MKNINVILVVILMFVTSYFSFGQADNKFTVKFKLIIHSGDFKNTTITITKNGTPFKVISPNGSFENVDLDLNANYSFVCNKMGYIAKTVTFDTHVPSGRELEDFAKLKSIVELYPQPEDAVVSYSQPVGKIQYSMGQKDFDWDKDYTSTALEMQKQAESHPNPKPLPPKPNPKPEPPPPPPPPPVVKSNPIPIVVKQPEIKHSKELPKDVIELHPNPEKKIVKNITTRIIQEDRKKVTIVNIVIDDAEFVYRKEEYSWGGVYFYKGSTFISERTFTKETEN